NLLRIYPLSSEDKLLGKLPGTLVFLSQHPPNIPSLPKKQQAEDESPAPQPVSRQRPSNPHPVSTHLLSFAQFHCLSSVTIEAIIRHRFYDMIFSGRVAVGPTAD
ncbi:MAG: hypothetical protein KDA36_12910, partial [Planctomycetaceae bacterium]|nr:hypothetical protein [Planctomycetaceae bacterium]